MEIQIRDNKRKPDRQREIRGRGIDIQKDMYRQRAVKTKDGWLIVSLPKNFTSQGQ